MKKIVLVLFVLLAAGFARADAWQHREAVAGRFEDIKENLVMAIEGRGLVINYVAHISDMLARTGADLGMTRTIYAQAEIVEFCSAKLSRRMMEMDPHNIVMCPFSISLYTLPDEAGKVWLSYRQPQGQAAPLVRELLDALLAEAAGR